MIKAGLNIGNAKLSCIVCDFKNSHNIKILSLLEIPTKEVKKNIVVNYSNLFEELKNLISESEKNSQTKINSINFVISDIRFNDNTVEKKIIVD